MSSHLLVLDSSSSAPLLPVDRKQNAAQAQGILDGRVVEKISIDNPAGLTAEIKKAKTVACIAVLVFGLAALLIISPGMLRIEGVISKTVHLGLLGSSLLLSFVAMAIFLPKGGKNDLRARELCDCQKAMTTEEFKTFAKEFAEDFTLDQLLKTHKLFLSQKNLDSYNTKLIEKQNALADQKAELQRSF